MSEVRSLFECGFSEYIKRGAFYDVILKHAGNEYKAHKLILCFSSKFFDRLFSQDSSFKEGKEHLVELKYPDPRNVFPEVIKFLYVGRMTLTWDRVIPLLAHADYYGIETLSNQCQEFINVNLKRKTVLPLFSDAIEFHLQDIIDRCKRLITANFLHMYDADFTWMDHTMFLSLLQDKRLAVRDEWPLYQTVVRYLEAKAASNYKLTSTQISELMEVVRYRWMTLEQLQTVIKDKRIPRSLLIEAMMIRMKEREEPSTARNQLSLRLQPRVSRGIEFEVNNNHRGIIYWLATQFGKKDWQNPMTKNAIKVTASSIERGETKQLLDPTPAELWTCDVPASWFCIDLQSWSVLPSAYTLRHGGNYVADSLRNWDLQGSVDGHTWTVLRRHYKDDSINGKFQPSTWVIKKNDHKQPYRLFRIIQTGHNSSNHNFLVLSLFELYGELWETEIAKQEFGEKQVKVKADAQLQSASHKAKK